MAGARTSVWLGNLHTAEKGYLDIGRFFRIHLRVHSNEKGEHKKIVEISEYIPVYKADNHIDSIGWRVKVVMVTTMMITKKLVMMMNMIGYSFWSYKRILLLVIQEDITVCDIIR